jgi:hypothetical protein
MRVGDYIPNRIRTIEGNIGDKYCPEETLIEYLDCLMGKQTYREQIERVALFNNAEGFNFPDSARVVEVYGEIKKNDNHIPDDMVTFVQKRLYKYARQIAFIKNIMKFNGFQCPTWVWEDSGTAPIEYRDIVYADLTRYSIKSIEVARHEDAREESFMSGAIVEDKEAMENGYLHDLKVAKSDVVVKTPDTTCCTIRDYMTYCGRKSELQRIYLNYQNG